jgi:hypothetical protein
MKRWFFLMGQGWLYRIHVGRARRIIRILLFRMGFGRAGIVFGWHHNKFGVTG